MASELELPASLKELIGTPEKALALKQKWDTESRVFRENVSAWAESFPDSWVAIEGANVIAIEFDHACLLDRVREQGIDPGHALIQFVPRPGTIFML